MKIDSPKGRVLLQEAETITCEVFCDLVCIPFLARKRESEPKWSQCGLMNSLYSVHDVDTSLEQFASEF